ncbi:hypothetical protein HZP84_07970 [Elizabethkingia anophelis]|nr:hypothetical protein [Elizabethkingia anophelis]MCT3728896.1 hypothetical protein [Elizabethkingia anophelis]MCT3776181.1 hypothetical protein [Elizabethkingia anophelis]MCT3788224.1 hypothetical protein [Elizabethkingia anophelis]MCT3790249.1 hypothetical protein [Elizabethkingia anophelis]
MILPAFVMLIGAGAAFASQSAKASSNSLQLKTGYIYNTIVNECIPVRQCSEIETEICTINDQPNGQPVYDLNVAGNFSSCNKALYRPQ